MYTYIYIYKCISLRPGLEVVRHDVGAGEDAYSLRLIILKLSIHIISTIIYNNTVNICTNNKYYC